MIWGASVQTVFHPISYAKFLVHLGHEPLNPVASQTMFGKHILCYPNILKYVSHIKKQDGFLGLYRGLGPSIVSGVLQIVVTRKVNEKLAITEKKSEEGDDESEDEEDNIIKFFREMGVEMIGRVSGIIASQPFRVIMIRSMAQFIGREETYSNSFHGISEIYRKEGILGFFAGLIPRVLGEMTLIWITNTLSFIITNYVLPKKDDMHKYVKPICAMVAAQFVQPFVVVSTVMSVNGADIAAGRPPLMPLYSSWRDCWAHLKTQNQLQRGAKMFYRYYTGRTITRYDGSLIPADPQFINLSVLD